MNQVKTQVIQKLNAIVELVRHCATKAVSTQDQTLMQEVTLAVVTHESICKMFEEHGPAENVVVVVNEFGHTVAKLYNKLDTFKPQSIRTPQINFTAKRSDKNLLN